MSERQASDLYPQAILLAHLRRVVIGDILNAIRPDQADQAVSAAIQRLVQYLEEGPVQSMAREASVEQFRATIEQVIEELQTVPRRSN